MQEIPHKTSDTIAQPFHEQVALVGTLLEENKARMASGQVHWDRWFETISKLPVEDQAHFSEEASTVTAIEAGASKIAIERDKLFALLEAAMHEKIQELAAASIGSGLSLGERISMDFASFREWRKVHLDGVDCDMFVLIEQRNPSKAFKRGKGRRPLFNSLFITWAKAADIPVREAEAAAKETYFATVSEQGGFKP